MTITADAITTSAAPPAGHVHGYARTSTGPQEVALQHDALRAAGCERLWTDVASGAATSRPQLDAMLETLMARDTLVVWRLDRLGRSMAHLLAMIEDLGARGVVFRSITEGIDTSTATGRLLFGIMSSLAQFERELIRERTAAGLQAARDRGRVLGRPSVMSADKLAAAHGLILGGATVTQAAAIGVSRPTLYRPLQADEASRQ